MLERLEYRLLKIIAPSESKNLDGSAYIGKNKLKVLLGEDIFEFTQSKTVIDFGCGAGEQSIELALNGAHLVIGVDIQEQMLCSARQRAQQFGVQHKCVFSTTAPECADVIISVDGFEHFSNPARILNDMWNLLKPGGCLVASFGPPWYHPFGGHLFSVFPWAHLVFSEKALILWRADIKHDGAQYFSEVAGGLNRMTLERFVAIVRQSPFQNRYIKAIPIRHLSMLHNRLTQEFTTSTVRCKLTKS